MLELDFRSEGKTLPVESRVDPVNHLLRVRPDGVDRGDHNQHQ
jgi:hypothetical protein